MMLPVPGWLQGSCRVSDVVVSSRVRLARNLTGYPFPAEMSRSEEIEVRDTVVDAFGRLPGQADYAIVRMENATQMERRMLLERSFVSQEFSIARNKALILRHDERFAAMVNEEDHLRAFAIQGGLRLNEAYENVGEVDGQLEDDLEFAVSLEWGYLTAALWNVGTGMRASVMLHLPALVLTGLIDRVVKEISQIGLAVKAFFGGGRESLGSLYQLSNITTLGLDEQSILENLEKVVLQVVNYERKARDEMTRTRRMELEDKILRAYGILRYCRYITTREAIARLSLLRVGIVMGVVDVASLADITALMFVSQKSHMRKLLGPHEDTVDTKLIDFTRADFIRRALKEGLSA